MQCQKTLSRGKVFSLKLKGCVLWNSQNINQFLNFAPVLKLISLSPKFSCSVVLLNSRSLLSIAKVLPKCVATSIIMLLLWCFNTVSVRGVLRRPATSRIFVKNRPISSNFKASLFPSCRVCSAQRMWWTVTSKLFTIAPLRTVSFVVASWKVPSLSSSSLE